MSRPVYFIGKALQIMGLIALPSAIWAGQLKHDEKGAIMIFLSSVSVFILGYFLCRISSKA